ncbi:ATP-binding protein [Actinospongicola halichondriae]|uniref:sensor histidine kinase n=1 Tax=Actinospongicola halichondriae TaxID=3236844 RepID=UPI003D414C1E
MTALDLDLLPDMVLLVDADGGLTGANRAAVDFLGPLDDRMGRPIAEEFDLRDGLGRPAWRDGIADIGKESEITFRRSDGEDVVAVVTVAFSGDGSAAICARPMSDKSGIAIVSTVSHELRSPLTSVKGYVSLMLSRWDRIDDAKKREMLEQVHHDADRVTRLVTELLDISRLETGRLVLQRQMVDLGQLASTVVAKVAMSYPALDCSVSITTGSDAYADPDKIEQVLTNLVENAAKYGDPTGMEITGGLEGDHFRISVTDRGDGIPADDLPRVFTKFFRRDHGRPTGTGLGLWISRGLVEAHDGELTATSTVGEGCTFSFTLPADAFDAIHGA